MVYPRFSNNNSNDPVQGLAGRPQGVNPLYWMCLHIKPAGYHPGHGVSASRRYGRLECPKCHAEMKIISFITRSQPEVIRQRLEHLGLWEKSRPPPVDTQTFQDVIQEPFDDALNLPLVAYLARQ